MTKAQLEEEYLRLRDAHARAVADLNAERMKAQKSVSTQAANDELHGRIEDLTNLLAARDKTIAELQRHLMAMTQSREDGLRALVKLVNHGIAPAAAQPVSIAPQPTQQ